MKPEFSEKVCLWILFIFCLTITSMLLKAFMANLSLAEFIRVFSAAGNLPVFWGTVITPVISGFAIVYIAVSKKNQTTFRSIVLAYLPAIALSLIMTTIGMQIVGIILLFSLSLLLYNSLKRMSNNS